MDGKEALGSWGTTTRDDIKRVLSEHWSLQKIIKATNRPFQGVDSQGVIDALKRNSHQKPKILTM